MKNIFFIFLFIFIGYFSASIYEYVAKNMGKYLFKKESLTVRGYKLHHSLYGLLSLLLAGLFFLKGDSVISKILFGVGIGIIIQHAITDGFYFLTKNAKENSSTPSR